MNSSKAPALRVKAGPTPVNAAKAEKVGRYHAPDLDTHPQCFDMYDMCSRCIHGERCEVKVRRRPDPLKFREKPKPVVRVIYRCKAARCRHLKAGTAK